MSNRMGTGPVTASSNPKRVSLPDTVHLWETLTYKQCSFTHHRVFIAICNGGVEIGRVNAFAPDYSKAKVAAAKLFALFDRESLINPTDTSGKTPVNECDTVRVRFKSFVRVDKTQFSHAHVNLQVKNRL